MGLSALVLIALANTTVVIDINGQVRELLPGEIPNPGEVIVIMGSGATVYTDVEALQVEDDGTTVPIAISDELKPLIDAIDQGIDPSKIEILSPAAGYESSAKPTNDKEDN
ncbi:hypothetical protein [Vibrio sp. RE88]|uniref:hypothetical protein n=1 Tax=Vibrio sp. RE88 TaxID=2607610 RepID=UPI00149382E8|nr:hypothetical protein [Vibrio sp. RE88]NOH63429.1 hypothetical protein [Vibrio sp. RE88]